MSGLSRRVLMESLICVERDLLSLYTDDCPTEKYNLGIWLHSVTICIPEESSQAVIRHTNNLVLFQEDWRDYRLTKIDQPVFEEKGGLHAQTW
jgi:hypothetical protein